MAMVVVGSAARKPLGGGVPAKNFAGDGCNRGAIFRRALWLPTGSQSFCGCGIRPGAGS